MLSYWRNQWPGYYCAEVARFLSLAMQYKLLRSLCEQDSGFAHCVLQIFDDIEVEVPPGCLPEVVRVLRENKRCGLGILRQVFKHDPMLAADAVVSALESAQPENSAGLLALARLSESLFGGSAMLFEQVCAAWQAARRKHANMPQLWERITQQITK